MRLHKMTLEAIGPFAARQEIDFDALGAGGMFLLEGPTGAGKTTVLEAITFALFGQGPRHEAEPARLHSHFATPEQRPSVELEFSVAGRRYRIVRTPRHERVKRRGSGFTTVNPTVLLQRRLSGEQQGWSELSHSHEEAGAIIGELLGLSREQFSQVVALPQGRFAQFLQADDEARRALLSKLFGTQIYDQITTVVEERARQVRGLISQSQARMAVALAAAYEAGGVAVGDDGQPQDAQWAPGDSQAALANLRDHSQAVRAALAQAVRRRAAAERRVVRLDRVARDAVGLADRLARLVSASAALQALDSSRDLRDEQQARLAAARAAAPVGLRLDELAAARELAVAAQLRLELAQDAASAAMQGCGAQWSAGTGLPGPWLSEVREGLAGEVAGLAGPLAAESGLPERRTRLDELNRSRRGLAEELAGLQESAAGLDQLATQAAVVLGEAADVAAGADLLAAQQARLQEQVSAAHLAARLDQDLGAAQAAAVAAVDAHQQLVDAHQELQERRIAGMSSELAASLVPGEPCCVCGGTEHPRPAAAAELVTAQMCRVAAQQRDRAQSKRVAAEAGLADLRVRLAAALAATAGAGAEQAEEALLSCSAQLSHARSAQAVVADMGQKVAEFTVLRQGAHEACERVSCQLAEVSGQSQELHSSIRADEAAVAAARGEFDSVAQRCVALTEAMVAIDQLVLAGHDHQAAEAQVQRLTALAGQELAVSGLGDEAQARAAQLDPEAQQGLETAVGQWDRQYQMLLGQVTAPDLVGLDPLDLEQAQKVAQAASLDLAQAQESAAIRRGEAEALSARLTRLDVRIDSLAQLVGAHDELVAGSEEVLLLDRLVRGQDPRKRMTLTTYVLRYWFAEVLDAANRRLAVMSAGKYQLIRVESGEMSRDRVGLGLAVLDQHTGKQRSARSLSGGETFYTSLALALGLSDVVSAQAGGVCLETLFIDEGFGSLDQQTLDEVMGVIDELRGNGRVVGVVSHVPELKDRIPERLEVRRVTSDGPSQVRVVA